MARRRLARALVTTAALQVLVAHAAHPLISEDTGTQGSGKTELELGTATTHVADARVRELDPQLSYGVLDNLDAILRPSVFWLTGSAADAAGRRHGLGSTALDVKWRAAGEGPWTFGMRGGLDLPTAQQGLGAQSVGEHVLAMATYDSEPLMGTVNLAYAHAARDPAVPLLRRDVVRASAGALLNVSEDVRLAGDLALYNSSDSTERGWLAVGVIGFIARLPWGFDVDAGYQFALNARAPTGAWLLGATVRW
jgi:hypothetical protein